jgi:flagellar hook-associated protein 1
VSALDQFFSGARDLSSDPASTVMRGSFLRDSENLAARFGELSSQLDLVQNETDETVKELRQFDEHHLQAIGCRSTFS